MKSTIFGVVLMSLAVAHFGAVACTTAVIHGPAARDGAPILWKNRDTSHLANKVVFVEETPFAFIGLVNAEEPSGRRVYAGLNTRGFGIMNSVAYNLPKDQKEAEDLEGLIMADALRTCQSVDDFESMIRENLGSGLGSRANFGVIDAAGHAVIFEVYNHGLHKVDAAEAARHILVNTNFSRSGEDGGGQGYLRFEQATKLLDGIPVGQVTPEALFGLVSRNLEHPLLDHPSWTELEQMPANPPVWITNNDCIDRPSTASVAVIQGRCPDSDDRPATFWILLGEPVTAIALPLWVEAGSVPAVFFQGEKSELNAESLRLKHVLYPAQEGSKREYLIINRLVNQQGTGFLPALLETEAEIFRETKAFLGTKRDAKELAAFQTRMAEKALTVLKSIQ